jgi:hypothetical protein
VSRADWKTAFEINQLRVWREPNGLESHLLMLDCRAAADRTMQPDP